MDWRTNEPVAVGRARHGLYELDLEDQTNLKHAEVNNCEKVSLEV